MATWNKKKRGISIWLLQPYKVTKRRGRGVGGKEWEDSGRGKAGGWGKKGVER
jgi:hypothetical protein